MIYILSIGDFPPNKTFNHRKWIKKVSKFVELLFLEQYATQYWHRCNGLNVITLFCLAPTGNTYLESRNTYLAKTDMMVLPDDAHS